MIKKQLFYLLSIFALFSCGENTEAEKPKLEENFSIIGNIKDGENTTLYLEAFSKEGTIPVAQTQTDANGHFVLKSNIPGLGIYQLRLGEAQDKVIPLTLNPKDKVTINTSFSEFEWRPNAKGTIWTKHLNFYVDKLAVIMKEQKAITQNEPNLSEEEMMARYFEFRKPLDEYAVKTIKEDPSNPFNIILSTSIMPTTGFTTWNPENLSLLKNLSIAFSKKYPNSPMSNTFQMQYEQVEVAYNQHKMTTGGGNVTAPEITLQNPNGKIIQLSKLKDKVVLIDFWASWCAPCRKENPNVVKLYQKYKSKGFDIFSVSLDSNPEAWKQAIKADGLIWENHGCDFQSWKSNICKTYNVQSIPHTVLINKKGEIIGAGLRGAELEQKLIEVLK